MRRARAFSGQRGQLSGDQRLDNVTYAAHVGAGPLLDPRQAVVGGVHVDVELLGGSLDVEVGDGVGA